MRDYILYHNATKMGYDLENIPIDGDDGLEWEYFVGDDDLEEYTFSIVTSNEKESQESIGQRVWVIQGSAESSPRRYYLHGYFFPIVTERCLIKIGDKEFKYRLLGNDDYLVRPLHKAAYLDRREWFGDFLREHKNFKTGFREIRDSAFVEQLDIYDHTLRQ